MTLTDLAATLRLDLGDSSGDLLDDASVRRALTRALPLVARDLGKTVVVVDDALEPEPDAVFRELLLLRAQAFACGMLRAKASQNFSFKSGDKEVDKTKQADWWAKQENDVLDEYKARVEELQPGNSVANLKPAIYEVGSEHHHHHRH